ncbi:MAG: dolichol-phosphate mannosyltransferase [Acidimicrobiia bacterium]|nr:MAG: dolichol-phosphate mannosyltransferase [Acidimicrobiia bacterium]
MRLTRGRNRYIAPFVRTLVVTPTYEEAQNIEEFLQRVRAAVPEADVLVVDDNSPDATADLAEKAAAELGGIEVLRRPRKIGLGDAYRAGFSVGLARGYDVLVQMDADLSHDPAAIPALLAQVERGAAVAIGSRYVPGGSVPHWPWFRRALSKWGNRYTTLVLGLPVSDATSGFRAYVAEALVQVDYANTRSKGYGFQIELAYRVWRWGGRIAQVPIVFTDRVRGHSKMTLAVAFEELVLVTWWGLRDRVLRPAARAVRTRRRRAPRGTPLPR